jgi:hypothetical protein
MSEGSDHFSGSMGLGSLFEAINIPDLMTPGQFADMVGKSGELKPEQRLKLAILEDAIACYLKVAPIPGYSGENRVEQVSNRQRRMHAEALEWIDGAYAAITFENCCESLGFNPEWMRKGILRGPVSALPGHGRGGRDSKIGTPRHRGRHPQSRRSPVSVHMTVEVAERTPRATSAFAPLSGHQVVMDGLFQEIAE